jgi:putative flippase GtrA
MDGHGTLFLGTGPEASGLEGGRGDPAGEDSTHQDELMAGIWRFLIAGIVNTLFGYLVFSLFIWTTQSAPLSVLMANLFGVTFNFFTYGKGVFGSYSWKRMPRFAAVYGINYWGNVAALAALRAHGVSFYIAQLAILPFSSVFLYCALRYLVFGPVDEAH